MIFDDDDNKSSRMLPLNLPQNASDLSFSKRKYIKSSIQRKFTYTNQQTLPKEITRT